MLVRNTADGRYSAYPPLLRNHQHSETIGKEQPVHIPDGMLQTQTWVPCLLGAGGVIGYASRWIKTHLDPAKIVVMATLAAMIFALQMLNFPVAGGTSGHFGGGVLAALILGPWPAAIVMTAVLIVQAFFFQDGGITVLGANILNMGVIAPFVGWMIYRALYHISASRSACMVWSGIAGWTGLFISACAVALELWSSNTANFFTALLAMGFWHALIGIGEGVITATVMGYLLFAKPELVYANQVPSSRAEAAGTLASSTSIQGADSNTPRHSTFGVALVLGLVALVAACLSFLASTAPDGLEYVFFDEMGHAEDSVVGSYINAPFSDYLIPGINNDTLAGITAGVIGLILVGLLIYAFLRLLVGNNKNDADHTSPVGSSRKKLLRHSFDVHDPSNPVVRLDARSKLICAILLIVAMVVTSPLSILPFCVLVTFVLVVARLGGVSIRALLKRSLIIIPFAGVVALFAPLRLVQEWSGPGIGAAFLVGWPSFLNILAIAWISALMVILLVATTGSTAIYNAFARMKLPDILVTLMMFIERYVSFFRAQIVDMQHAIKARAPHIGNWQTIKLYGNLSGSLLIRCHERGTRIYAAMASRGYEGTMPVDRSTHIGAAELCCFVLSALIISALFLF
jgi:cobalt/nickel transport system permease protein